MRILGFILLSTFALVAAALLPGVAIAGEYVINKTETSAEHYDAALEAAGSMGDPCNPCASGGHHKHGHHGRRRGRYQNVEGRSDYYNCGCNGSYKYPVPPLYTYHWRGQFSAQLMTDYHSPWRFPPLRPYVDEEVPGTPVPGTIPAEPAPLNGLGESPFRPASYVAPVIRPALPESGFTEMSQAMDRLYR